MIDDPRSPATKSATWSAQPTCLSARLRVCVVDACRWLCVRPGTPRSLNPPGVDVKRFRPSLRRVSSVRRRRPSPAPPPPSSSRPPPSPTTPTSTRHRRLRPGHGRVGTSPGPSKQQRLEDVTTRSLTVTASSRVLDSTAGTRHRWREPDQAIDQHVHRTANDFSGDAELLGQRRLRTAHGHGHWTPRPQDKTTLRPKTSTDC